MEDKGDVAFALTNPSNDSKVVIATQFHMLSAAHPNRWAAFIRFGCFVALLFSCGARRRVRRRSLSNAALALAIVFDLASAAGLYLGASSIEKLLHHRYGACSGK